MEPQKAQKAQKAVDLDTPLQVEELTEAVIHRYRGTLESVLFNMEARCNSKAEFCPPLCPPYDPATMGLDPFFDYPGTLRKIKRLCRRAA